MTLVWANFEVSGGGGCTCCGGVGPSPNSCMCALFIPPLEADYPNYAAANTAIQNQTNSCYGYVNLQAGGSLTSLAANVNGNTLTINVAGNPDNAPSCQAMTWGAFSALGGSQINVGIQIGNFGDTNTALYHCNGTLIASNTGATPHLYTLGATGEFLLSMTGVSQNSGMGGSDTFDFSVAGNNTTVFLPAVALWDDSGTTRQLEACPKLYLPPLTESSGDWYADCAAADAILTDSLQVSNCVGYFDNSSATPDSSSATDGGSSLTFAQTFSTPPGDSSPAWGSVNAEAGETLSFAFTGNGSPGGGDPTYAEAVIVTIYDYTGTVVYSGATDGSTAGPLVSSALPYTGRYIVRVVVSCTLFVGTCFTSCSATVTSSGTMSVNPIQALYDVGLTCPARINCGDSCP